MVAAVETDDKKWMLTTLVDTEANGGGRMAVREVLNRLLPLLEKGDWKRLDNLLHLVDPSRHYDTVTLTFLSITCNAKSRLPSWQGLYNRVNLSLSLRVDPAVREKLLQGL